MSWLWRLLCPLKPFGLFLEGMAWYGGHIDLTRWGGIAPMRMSRVDAPGQVGPLRSDPEHYDEMGRYLWWGA